MGVCNSVFMWKIHIGGCSLVASLDMGISCICRVHEKGTDSEEPDAAPDFCESF
jgi:hypothetical protein